MIHKCSRDMWYTMNSEIYPYVGFPRRCRAGLPVYARGFVAGVRYAVRYASRYAVLCLYLLAC